LRVGLLLLPGLKAAVLAWAATSALRVAVHWASALQSL
jgi:hypothetical protein